MDCSNLTQAILATLGNGLRCIPSGDRFRIVTPFRRPGGDLIDVYVRPQFDGSVVVSDLGESIGYLISMGYDPRSGTNSGFILKHLPHRYGVELRPADGVIRIHTEEGNVAQAVWSLIEASLAVSHMLYMSRASAPSTIDDEVASVLVQAEVRFDLNKQVVGDTGKKFRADFAFLGLLGMSPSEGLVKTLSAESGSGRVQAVNATFRMWSEVQKKAGLLATIVDDRYAEWPGEDIASLEKLSQVYYWAAETEQLRFRDDVRLFAVGVGGRRDQSKARHS